MSLHNWRRCALIAGMVIGIVGLGGLLIHYALVKLDACSQANPKPTFRADYTNPAFPFQVLPKPKNQSLRTSEKRLECDLAEGTKDYELCQQWRSANASAEQACIAGHQFWLSILAAYVSLLALLGLGATVYYTRTAAGSALDAARAAKNSARTADATLGQMERAASLELRAYLSVVPAGINELIGSQKAMGHVYVRNVGRLPARNVSVQIRMRIDTYDDTLSSRENEFEVRPDNQKKIDRVIQPGAEMMQGCDEDNTVAIGTLLDNVQKQKYVYVWGVVYYDDGYLQRRFTKFRHRYAIASRNRNPDINWNDPATETREVIAVNKARYHPFGNNAT